ncbi:hypothetical protein QCM77_24560 [Bradyrhizobium sp. SSUT18]|uniref:hypothetical protein n=1 Tax=Bradyrhizobium sp. SSUT77 TaxID=3040603 RepID=UPI00244ABD07|nr:hypothetical protein [Bradyrhizobium sp. SSUT77]MDH2340880.1 hypothetical protein [Bradyrhizobium sp. SSUT77]MDH2403105.1 hypothetical protein [Bradyrhizobium sp. SSUT18]
MSKMLSGFARVLTVLLTCSCISVASDNSTDLRNMLQELRGSTHVFLMLVPYRSSFRVRIDEVALPDVSCVYEVASGNSAFGETLDAIRTRVVLFDDPKPFVDLRVGVVFKRNEKIVQGFYFNDLGGYREVGGFSGELRVEGAPDLPSYLRSIAMKPGVSLVRDRHPRCPHA